MDIGNQQKDPQQRLLWIHWTATGHLCREHTPSSRHFMGFSIIPTFQMRKVSLDVNEVTAGIQIQASLHSLLTPISRLNLLLVCVDSSWVFKISTHKKKKKFFFGKVWNSQADKNSLNNLGRWGGWLFTIIWTSYQEKEVLASITSKPAAPPSERAGYLNK